jgi:hypothetical protein
MLYGFQVSEYCLKCERFCLALVYRGMGYIYIWPPYDGL